MIQDKAHPKGTSFGAQSAGNGESFSRTATPYWIIRVAPLFGQSAQQTFNAVVSIGRGEL